MASGSVAVGRCVQAVAVETEFKRNCWVLEISSYVISDLEKSRWHIVELASITIPSQNLAARALIRVHDGVLTVH
jgi:hypothetical protein